MEGYSVYKTTRLGVKKSIEEILLYRDEEVAKEVTAYLNSKSRDLVAGTFPVKVITFSCRKTSY